MQARLLFVDGYDKWGESLLCFSNLVEFNPGQSIVDVEIHAINAQKGAYILLEMSDDYHIDCHGVSFIHKNNYFNFNESEKVNDYSLLYPNPASIYLNIQGPNGYEIFNSHGLLMRKSNLPFNKIDISELPSGLYILRSEQKSMGFIKSL